MKKKIIELLQTTLMVLEFLLFDEGGLDVEPCIPFIQAEYKSVINAINSYRKEMAF